MPKLSGSTKAARFVAEVLTATIEKKGHQYIGHTLDISDDGRVACVAYSYPNGSPRNPVATVVTDATIVRALLKGEVPAEAAEAPAPTPAVVQGGKRR